MNAPGNVLEATGLTKRFGRRTAVDALSFDVAEGEIVGFLGANGAGKSTSIAMLSGSLTPDAGTVRVGGVDLAAHPAAAKRQLGVVPQDIALYPTLTGRQNLRFFAGAQGLSRRERAHAVRWALDAVGLADRGRDSVATYSGGMRRRLNIAAGVLHRPRLLFLDEPTVGVDPQSRHQIFETVRRMRADHGMAVVYTSHYMPEVEQLCDRVVILDGGRILAAGTCAELVAPLGGGILVWPLDPGELAALPEGVTTVAVALRNAGDVTVEGATIRVRVEGMRRTLTEVLRVASELNLCVGGLRVLHPDVETLFLDLTGRTLRDGS
ncbi:ABC transporter ATP-binding protein [Streptomyces sp. NPDC059009]|uniref:ABC transporter ATP-binding protein n=1 Tax=Streptomyces sp. NPDC059009 TaxID=3346694 RepID=UPI0036C5A11D